MIDLDIKTLFSLFAICNIFIGLILLVFNYSNNNQKEVTYLYLITKFIVGITWFLYSLRGDGYFFLSYIVANTTVLLAILFEFYCFSHINRKLNFGELSLYVLITLILSSSLFYFAGKPDSLKVIHMSAVISMYYLIGGIYILNIHRKSRSIKLIALLGFIVSITFASKVVTGVFFDNNISLFSQNVVIVISYLIIFLIPFCWTILYLLMLNELSQKEILVKNKAIASDNIKLKNLNTTKDKIFSIIAHDLRGPIGGIIQLGQMLSGKLGKLTNKEKDDVIGLIMQTATSTNNVLNNLLQWARSESGALSIEKKPISIFELVEESEQLLSESIKEKNIEFQNATNKEIRVLADYNMSFTIIRNLIANAIKFTHKNGNVSINDEIHEDYLKVYVRDNGVGIPKDVIHKLFDPNFQFYTEGTSKEPGTGIGLKLCKEFTNKNGGDIGVESKEGEGSTFYFTMPLDRN